MHKANLTNQITRERGGAVVGLGPTRSPNTYEVQKWNGGATVGQKAFKKWEWPGSCGLGHKWLGPRPRRLDQTSPDQTRPD